MSDPIIKVQKVKKVKKAKKAKKSKKSKKQEESADETVAVTAVETVPAPAPAVAQVVVEDSDNDSDSGDELGGLVMAPQQDSHAVTEMLRRPQVKQVDTYKPGQLGSFLNPDAAPDKSVVAVMAPVPVVEISAGKKGKVHSNPSVFTQLRSAANKYEKTRESKIESKRVEKAKVMVQFQLCATFKSTMECKDDNCKYSHDPALLHESSQKPQQSSRARNEAEDAKLAEQDRLRREGRKIRREKREAYVDDKLPRTVFVGNVSSTAKDKDLKKFFSACGKVDSVRLRSLMFKDPTLPRFVGVQASGIETSIINSCNAYVVFATEEAAKKALEKNGVKFQGLTMRVAKATAQGEKNKYKASKPRTVHVRNMPYDTNDQALYDHFEICGDVESVRIIRDKQTRLGKGFGYVCFKDKASVPKALGLHELIFRGRKMIVQQVLTDKQIAKKQAHFALKSGGVVNNKFNEYKEKFIKKSNGKRAASMISAKPSTTPSFQGQRAKTDGNFKHKAKKPRHNTRKPTRKPRTR